MMYCSVSELSIIACSTSHVYADERMVVIKAVCSLSVCTRTPTCATSKSYGYGTQALEGAVPVL